MARRGDEPGSPHEAGDPRYVIRVPDDADDEPEVVQTPVRGGRTDPPQDRPASDYVFRVSPEAPAASSPQGADDPGPAAPADEPTVVQTGRPPRRRLSRRVRWLLVAGALAVAVGLAALVLVRSGIMRDPNPFAGRELYVDPDSEAARAVDAATDSQTREAFLVLADQPTAIWLTPEEHPTGEVGSYVAEVVASAEASGTVPVFVVYGIPDRDCGQLSAGGATVEGYGPWVGEIAAALDGTQTPVILEPDAVSLAEQCGDVDQRMSLLTTAGATLTDAGALVYLDGGHSNWHSVREAAGLLREAGVADVHGFATNVSNYNRDASELAYAQRLSAQLDGAPFVIDTGRNGNGSDGTWCNPEGAALGALPLTLVADGLDANLWVKPPGESDGACDGGPGAGEWWPDRALSLVIGARR